VSSLFKPDIPQEDPEIARQRKLEQERAERDRIKAIQEQLRFQTEQRSGGFGLRSLLSPRSGGGGAAPAVGLGGLLGTLLGSR
jgi:hypothetical protein